jgi:hypothetical protein
MNLFVLDEKPTRAAFMLDDVRVGKMLIETGQMLATALRQHGATDEDLIEVGFITSKGTPWRSTHANHPCTRWVAETNANAWWAWEHAEGLAWVYRNRFDREHACARPIHKAWLLIDRFIPHGERTPFVLAMPDEFKSDDPIDSYRRYYLSKENVKWERMPRDGLWIVEYTTS